MAKIENYGFNLKEAPKEQEGEAKDYPPRKVEKNKDYVVTLDIENKNRGFKDKANPIENFKDNWQANREAKREIKASGNKEGMGKLKAFWEKTKGWLKGQNKDSLKLVTYQQAETNAANLEAESKKIEGQKRELQEIIQATNSSELTDKRYSQELKDTATILKKINPQPFTKTQAELLTELENGKESDKHVIEAYGMVTKILETKPKGLSAQETETLWAWKNKHKSKFKEMSDLAAKEADTALKKESYRLLGELIKNNRTLNVGQLGETFLRPGYPNKAAQEKGLQAIDLIRKTVPGLDLKSKQLLDSAEKFLKLDLGIK